MALRRLFALLLAAALLGAACSGGGEGVDVGTDETDAEGGEAAEGGTLTAAIGGEPDRFDPHLTSAYPTFQVLENVYDTLVQPGEDLQMEPALAESWEVSDDGLTWTFDLRDGVTWHNGREFVASDVVYSFERIMDPETGAANAYRFATVESVEAPDDDTVVINVTETTPNLLTLIGAFKGMAIIPREIVEDGTIDRQPVGTGPFEFVEYVANDRIVLERFEDYWQEDLPYLQEVVFRPIPDPTVKLTNLQTGEVDWVDNVPPQQIDQLRESDDVELETSPSNDYWYMAFNMNRPPFDQREVRRAMAFAIDRGAVTEAALFNAGTPNQTAIPESNFWYHDYQPFEVDLDQARELLAEAGVGDGFSMDLMVTDEYPHTVTAAQVIASELQEIGIEVSIRTLDFSTWLAEQSAGNFDAFLLGWLGNLDPHGFYYAQHRTGANFNFHGYSNPEVDELLDDARVETDQDRRKELYDQAAELIIDDVSYLYLYNPDAVAAWRPAVEGYDVRADQAIRFVDTHIDEG